MLSPSRSDSVCLGFFCKLYNSIQSPPSLLVIPQHLLHPHQENSTEQQETCCGWKNIVLKTSHRRNQMTAHDGPGSLAVAFLQDWDGHYTFLWCKTILASRRQQITYNFETTNHPASKCNAQPYGKTQRKRTYQASCLAWEVIRLNSWIALQDGTLIELSMVYFVLNNLCI